MLALGLGDGSSWDTSSGSDSSMTDIINAATGGATVGAGGAAATSDSGQSFLDKALSWLGGVAKTMIMPSTGVCPPGYAPGPNGTCVSLAPPTPWYKTPIGILGIAAGVGVAGYVGYRLTR